MCFSSSSVLLWHRSYLSALISFIVLEVQTSFWFLQMTNVCFHNVLKEPRVVFHNNKHQSFDALVALAAAWVACARACSRAPCGGGKVLSDWRVKSLRRRCQRVSESRGWSSRCITPPRCDASHPPSARLQFLFRRTRFSAMSRRTIWSSRRGSSPGNPGCPSFLWFPDHHGSDPDVPVCCCILH